MLKENFSEEEKKNISNQIKPIEIKTIEKEFTELKKIGMNASSKSERCRVGNSIVDYFTFVQRLHTRGKYNVNYFEFIHNIEIFKGKNLYKIC